MLQRVATLAVVLGALHAPGAAAHEVEPALECLALNVYHEARGEGSLGERAVAHVTVNRVASRRFPDSVCEVVQQGSQRRGGSCQFSWWCDGRRDQPRNERAWRRALDVAYKVLMRVDDVDPTAGSLWYHAKRSKPVWRTRLVKYRAIGKHVFYNKQWKW